MSLLKTRSIHNVVVCDARAQEVIVHWCIDNMWHTHRHEGRAQNVLSFLMNDARMHKVNMDDVVELGLVMEGPSFTATRVMTVIANTWGFISGKKVRVLSFEFSSYDNEKKNASWCAAVPRDVVLPIYNAAPNITLKT